MSDIIKFFVGFQELFFHLKDGERLMGIAITPLI